MVQPFPACAHPLGKTWINAIEIRGIRDGLAQMVKAGILVYVNELAPSQSEVADLQKEMVQQRTDITPMVGSADYYALSSWYAGASVPAFSDAFLLQRAVRLVPVDPANISTALQQIDVVVADIELCAMNENVTGDIPSNWPATGDDHDCAACDFRRFCPSPAWARANPSAPAQPIVAPG